MKNPKNLECMEFSVKLFRMVGCWPNWKNKHKRSEQIYFCFTAATYVVLFIYTLILAYGLTYNYATWNSLDEAIEELIVFATGFIVLLKISLILWNQNKLQIMIDYINKDLNKRQLRDQEDNSVIKSCIKHEKSLTKTYIFFGYCITVLYTTSSIIRILRERLLQSRFTGFSVTVLFGLAGRVKRLKCFRSSGHDSGTLPLKYPFRPQHFPMYHILYLHQMIVMILNGHIGTLADTFFSSLTYYICGHFEIIKNRISKEGGIITRQFVSYHNETIRMVEKLQEIFGFFLMFQLTINSLLICLGLLQITQTSNIKLLHYIKCLIYVAIKLSQMFLYCWYGEEIKKKSSSIAFGTYSGLWHDFQSKRTTLNIRMVLFRSLKPVQIKAGAYFLLSLPTLAKVMNTAYSFFTMIKTTQKTEK